MVVELSVERMNGNDNHLTRGVKDKLEIFTVHVDETRILTVFSRSDAVMEKWVSQIQKANRNKKEPLVVGLCVDKEFSYGKEGLIDDPYDLIILCVGNNCLIYQLPGYHYHSSYLRRHEKTVEPAPRVLMDFLAEPNTIVVGMNLNSVSKKLEKDHKMEMSRAVDLRRLGVKALGALAMKNMAGQNEINMKMLDKHKDVVKPESVDRWTDPDDKCWGWRRGYYSYDINRHYAKYLTVDAFLAREIGLKYLDTIEELFPSGKDKMKKLLKA